MLEVHRVAVKYGAVVAVDGVDLTVPDGDGLALLGPSGCGSRPCCAPSPAWNPLRRAASAGTERTLPRSRYTAGGSACCSRTVCSFRTGTWPAIIACGLRFTRLGRAESKHRAAELQELVGLEGYGPRRVSTLSGGEAQRVALASALAPRPRLLLLDEPLAALDRSPRERLLADLKTVLTRTATTALFVIHDQGEAFAVADRVAVMRSGSIRQARTPREV